MNLFVMNNGHKITLMSSDNPVYKVSNFTGFAFIVFPMFFGYIGLVGLLMLIAPGPKVVQPHN